jgi:predicted ester cyclase
MIPGMVSPSAFAALRLTGGTAGAAEKSALDETAERRAQRHQMISISSQETEFVLRHSGLSLGRVIDCDRWLCKTRKGIQMSKVEDNKAIVGRWFTEFWGKNCNLDVVDELAAPDMLLQYSLHERRRGRDDIKAFMTDFRRAFPDLNFWGTADLIAEGDYVVGQWEGGGTHTGPAFSDFLMGSLPPATGRKMHFTGTTVLRIQNGKITQEIGLDDGVKALTQLGLIRAA